MRKRLPISLSVLFIGLLLTLDGLAQNTSFEFWPESDIWYRLTPSWRLSSFIALTKYDESKNRDLNIYLQADYAWGRTKRPFLAKLVDDNRVEKVKPWLVRWGFMEGWSLGENSGDYTEDQVFAEIHKRVPYKRRFLLSFRLRTDCRWLGQDPVFSYRFRYRMMLEKEYDCRRSTIVPYVNAEFYYDSRYTTVNRVRLIAGTTVSWGPRLAYEGNITYQYDSHYDTVNLFALNIILHVFFETTRAKPKTAG